MIFQARKSKKLTRVRNFKWHFLLGQDYIVIHNEMIIKCNVPFKLLFRLMIGLSDHVPRSSIQPATNESNKTLHRLKTGDPCWFGRGRTDFQFGACAHLGPPAAVGLSPNLSPCPSPPALLPHRSPLAVLLRNHRQRAVLACDKHYKEGKCHFNKQKVSLPCRLRMPPLPLRLDAGRALLASRSPFFSRFSLFSLLSDGASFTKGFFFPTVSQEVLKRVERNGGNKIDTQSSII